MPSEIPSVTYWNRLEPRPRAPSISETLAAPVRDPLWMLTRQWQLAEFHGEDAGSPAWVRLTTRVSPFVGWQARGGAAVPLDGRRPLERAVQAEAFGPDLATRVELGHTFMALLTERLAPAALPAALLDAVRAAYPIGAMPDARRIRQLFQVAWDLDTADPAPGGSVAPALLAAFGEHGLALPAESSATAAGAGGPWLLTDIASGQPYLVVAAGDRLEVHLATVPDRDAARFRQLCAGRAVDGAALYRAAGSTDPPPLDDPTLPAAQRDAVRLALDDLRAWTDEVFGALGTGDAPAWRPERLEYGLDVLATGATGDVAALAAVPDREGDFDWYAFDLRGSSSASGVTPGQVVEATQHLLPVHVRFHGMPNARWWDFEAAETDFGEIKPDTRDLAKLVVMDFMLVHGNDWFLLPFDQPSGTLCTVASLLVRDVFGHTFLVERADATSGPPMDKRARWTMFSTTSDGDGADGTGLADFFLLPLGAGTAVQAGTTLEEVRFLRDDGANLVWAVEHTTENGIGEPWPGHERDRAVASAPPPAPGDGAGGEPPLRYRIQTPSPEHWIPLLPVSVDPVAGRIALERGTAFGTAGGLTAPAGRLLAPTDPVAEEEIPPVGVTVSRVVHRSRWTDGTTHLWISRRRATGAGVASSGLTFDQVDVESR